jgi:hypothetical protein
MSRHRIAVVACSAAVVVALVAVLVFTVGSRTPAQPDLTKSESSVPGYQALSPCRFRLTDPLKARTCLDPQSFRDARCSRAPGPGSFSLESAMVLPPEFSAKREPSLVSTSAELSVTAHSNSLHGPSAHSGNTILRSACASMPIPTPPAYLLRSRRSAELGPLCVNL